MKFNPVLHYYTHMIEKKLTHIAPVFHGITKYGNTLGIVIDRQDQFQTELFIVPPELELIEFHIHPNVDSIEVPICGDFVFTTNGQAFKNEELPAELGRKVPAWVGSHDIHGATWSGGGAFLSFQYWKNGVPPTSVTKDYLLDEKNEHHGKDLIGLPEDDFNKLNRLKKD